MRVVQSQKAALRSLSYPNAAARAWRACESLRPHSASELIDDSEVGRCGVAPRNEPPLTTMGRCAHEAANRQVKCIDGCGTWHISVPFDVPAAARRGQSVGEAGQLSPFLGLGCSSFCGGRSTVACRTPPGLAGHWQQVTGSCDRPCRHWHSLCNSPAGPGRAPPSSAPGPARASGPHGPRLRPRTNLPVPYTEHAAQRAGTNLKLMTRIAGEPSQSEFSASGIWPWHANLRYMSRQTLRRAHKS